MPESSSSRALDPRRVPSFFFGFDARRLTRTAVNRQPFAYLNAGGPDQTDWVDTNGDGLADGWTVPGGNTPSIVTGNGFAGNAQRIAYVDTTYTLNRSVPGIVRQAGRIHRLRYKYRCDGLHRTALQGGYMTSWIAANTGDAKQVELIGAVRGINDLIAFQSTIYSYFEVDEIEITEYYGSETDSVGVGVWPTFDGEGVQGLQATATKQPRHELDGSCRSLWFDHIDDRLVSGAFPSGKLSGPKTIMTIARFDNSDTAQGYLFDGLTSTERAAVYVYVNNHKISLYGGGGIISETVMPSDRWCVVIGVFDGTDSALYLDFDLIGSGDGGTNDMAGISIGSRYSDQAFWDGEIRAILAFASNLTDAERIGVTRWCVDEYGVEA